jgi:hypothetical protein
MLKTSRPLKNSQEKQRRLSSLDAINSEPAVQQIKTATTKPMRFSYPKNGLYGLL